MRKRRLRNWVISLFGVALIATLSLALIGCGETALSVPEGPVYLPQSIITNTENGAWCIVYEYDEHGNLEKSGSVKIEMPHHEPFESTDDFTNYTSYWVNESVTTYQLDQDGYPIASTTSFRNGNNWGEITNSYEIEHDELGLWTKISCVADNDTEWDKSFEYDGLIPTKIKFNSSTARIDEDGWPLGSGVSMYDDEISYNEEGYVTSIEATGRGTLNGCTEIEYIRIDQPSASAYAFSHLKFSSFGLPMTWLGETDQSRFD